TQRDYDSYGIVYYDGYWYTAGYCHLRKDYRTFRIDRIINANILEPTFTPPSDFDTLKHVSRSLNQPSGIEQVKVLFKTTLDTANTSLPPELGTMTQVEEGVLFTRPAYRLEWIAPMLLSLNFPIKIIQPIALKNEMKALAHRALNMIEET
ncbi:MAG: WYL domain-containing protein, partial [Chloroflexota bacterium]